MGDPPSLLTLLITKKLSDLSLATACKGGHETSHLYTSKNMDHMGQKQRHSKTCSGTHRGVRNLGFSSAFSNINARPSSQTCPEDERSCSEFVSRKTSRSHHLHLRTIPPPACTPHLPRACSEPSAGQLSLHPSPQPHSAPHTPTPPPTRLLGWFCPIICNVNIQGLERLNSNCVLCF